MDDFEGRRTSFGASVDAGTYDDVRPGYPAEAADWLVGSPPGPLTVLDLGAGTGKLARRLVEGGHDVVAVDPAEEMLRALSARLPDVDVRVGTGEEIPADDASADAVTVAQAWHWFDVARATTEIARVLRPGGTLGITWNVRDGRVPWVAELDELGGEGTAGSSDTRPWQEDLALPPPWGRGERRLFTHDLVLPTGRLRDLAASWSVVARRPDRDELLAAVDDVATSAAAGNPSLAIPLFCRCWRFRRP